MAKDNPFDPDLVRELATLIADTDLTEIEGEKGDLRIRVARTITATMTVPVSGAFSTSCAGSGPACCSRASISPCVARARTAIQC